MTVTYEVVDGIAYLAFNRPEKHNALRDEDLQSLIDALGRLDEDEEAQVAILSGNGPSFSSGGDVKARLQSSVDDASTEGRVNEGSTFTSCANFKPVIAAVHGYCLGHALGTALSCDHLIAAKSTVFQVTEIKLGLPMSSFVPRLGSPAFANEVCTTGRKFSAEEAYAAGFVTRLVEDEDLLASAEDLARLIMGNPPSAIREHVRVRRTLLAQQLERYQELSGDFHASWSTNAEARQAVASLSESES
jgi:enoyl-CoA hydratase/carnithine racemase